MSSYINMKNIKKIQKFLDELQWMFAIQNFERYIETPDKDYEDYSATINYEEDYQRITIKLYPMFFKETLEAQRKALLHELCHTITVPMNTLIETLTSGKIVTQENARIVLERTNCQIENMMDMFLRNLGTHYKKAYAEYANVPKKKVIKHKKKKTS